MVGMSTGRRAYDLLRGFVNTEWERIRGVEDRDAINELNAPYFAAGRTASASDPQETVREANPEEAKAWAKRILGTPEGADFTEVRKAFEKLNSRSDPSKFPAGSPEARQASEIQSKVRQAYAILTEDMDATEKRFKSLEID